MSRLIAVAGKGGTGKTTVAALLIRHLVKTGRTPVFAVDADPNYTLGEALGIKVEQTIGTTREKFTDERTDIPAGMSREAVLERNMHATLHESRDVDLLVMGRQEGPGCYCYLNNVLRKFLEVLASDYPFVVVDNEAGMEHLSRRNTRKVDTLLVVCDHSVKAARAAGRIVDLVEELDLDVGKKFLVVNRSPESISERVQAEIDRSGLEVLARLPEDPRVQDADVSGSSLFDLQEDTPAIAALEPALESLLKK
jgi:CO dehydrogenase maturation factor